MHRKFNINFYCSTALFRLHSSWMKNLSLLAGFIGFFMYWYVAYCIWAPCIFS